MPSSTDPTDPPSWGTELDVRGALPPDLSGRLIGIGTDGVVHSLDLHSGRARYTAGHRGPVTVPRDLVAFDNSIFAIGEDFSVHELSTGADTLREVDLAGCGRVLAACPRPDPMTGALHLVTRDPDGAQEHVVIAAGALTRRSRPITDPPGRIESLAVAGDHVVFVADGMVGVATRHADTLPTWIETDTAAPRPIHTYQFAGRIVLLALTPSLERWTLHADDGLLHREVIDPTPARLARSTGAGIDGVPRSVWTTGDEMIGRHDLAGSRIAQLDVTPNTPGDFVLVPAQRPTGTVDAGWFVGVVHDASDTTAVLTVIDMADFAGASVSTARLPGVITPGLRCEWLPSTVR